MMVNSIQVIVQFTFIVVLFFYVTQLMVMFPRRFGTQALLLSEVQVLISPSGVFSAGGSVYGMLILHSVLFIT